MIVVRARVARWSLSIVETPVEIIVGSLGKEVTQACLEVAFILDHTRGIFVKEFAYFHNKG